MAAELRPGPLALGVALRQARKSRGMTQMELAGETGVPQNTISAIERGLRGAPNPANLARLEAALQLPAGSLRDVSTWAVAVVDPRQRRRDALVIDRPSPTLRRVLDRLLAMEPDEVGRLARELGIVPEE